MTGAVGTAAVMGAGAWGTALAKVLADAGNEVRLWARNIDVAREINDAHTNTPYLPEVKLPGAIRATTDAAEALDDPLTVAAQRELETILETVPKSDKERRGKLAELNEEMARLVVTDALDELVSAASDLPGVTSHVTAVHDAELVRYMERT